MEILFRQRAVMFPVSALLNSITNLAVLTFTPKHREQLLTAAVLEYLWVTYHVVSAENTIHRPGVEGRFSWVLQKILSENRVKLSRDVSTLELSALRENLFQRIAVLFIQNGFPLNEYHSRTPGCFDHGFRLSIIKPQGRLKRNLGLWLSVEWSRPVVDMCEMSVTAYVLFLARSLATRRQPVGYWHQRIIELPVNSLTYTPNLTTLKNLIISAGEKHASN